MVAASRSGSTSVVIRLSSPSASTFSSQASRSLELAGRGVLPTGAWVVGRSLFSGLIETLISMFVSRLRLVFLFPAKRSSLSIEAQLCLLDELTPAARVRSEKLHELLG